jgi:hypothetical protein
MHPRMKSLPLIPEDIALEVFCQQLRLSIYIFRLDNQHRIVRKVHFKLAQGLEGMNAHGVITGGQSARVVFVVKSNVDHELNYEKKVDAHYQGLC